MNVNVGDKITITHSSYVWKVAGRQGDTLRLKRVGGDHRITSVGTGDVLSIVERAKTADDFRRLAEEK